MKRFALLLLLAISTSIASTAIERPPLAVAFTYDYATEYRQHGFGIKLQARAGNHFRLETELIYCNQNRDATTLHLNMNLHYIMPVSSRFNIYPFAGVGYSHWGYVGPNANRWGLNLGAGIEYDLGKRWGVLAEMRLQAVKKETQLLYTLGIKRSF